MMPPTEWQGNEENYLGLAWRRFSPENLVQISALRDTANHRFFFEYLTGFSIIHIGFEWTHTLGRLIVALMYSASLITFFRILKLSTIASCTILLTFVWLGEDILGREWLFKGFEQKTLAYPFVFFSFSSSLKKRFGYSYIGLAIATYFHFLIGSFWFFVTLLGELYWTRNLKQTLIDSLIYLSACFPLFSIIFFDQFQALNIGKTQPSASWIYTYFRNPHHLAPFASVEQFKSWYRDGIVFLFGLTVTSVVLYRSGNRNEKEFSKLILALNLYLVFSLLISYFDKDGIFGKFYLFRPSSITLFLTLCLYGLFLKNRFSANSKQISFVGLVLISCLTIPNLQGHDLIVKSVVHKPQSYSLSYENEKDSKLEKASQFNNNTLARVIQYSNNTDIFLIDPKIEDSYLFFERKYNRPTLVSLKFVPTKEEEIVRWYKLLKLKDDLFKKGCPSEITSESKIRYILADKDNKNVNNCGKEIHREGGVKLMELDIN